MTKGVYKILPKTYFNGLYQKVIDKLVLGQNVLVAVPYGGGAKTFNNFFVYNCTNGKQFDQVIFFDPEIENENIVKFVKRVKNRHSGKILIVTRLSAKTKNLTKLLEQLNRLRLPYPEKLVYLATTDHTGVSSPEKYFAETNVFFPERFIIESFDIKQTMDMVEVLNTYYGWEVNKKDINEIYKLTGGIPRLIKIVCKELSENRIKISDFEYFLQEPSIIFQLKYSAGLLFKYDNNLLIRIGLLDRNGHIISSLLEGYFNSYTSKYIEQNFSNLTVKETEILTYFYENKNKIITTEKLAELLNMSDEDYSLWAIYKSISRLKKKVCDLLEIENIKGRGYVLRKVD